MSELTPIGRGDISGRDLFVVDARGRADAISALPPARTYFACLLAWDATSAADADIGLISKNLLAWALRDAVYELSPH